MSDEVTRQAERLRRALSEPYGLVISADLDGLLSAALILRVADLPLMGFFDSRSTLWQYPEDLGVGSRPLYLDVHVADDRVLSVDQHIIAVDINHARKLMRSGNKINPNLARPTGFRVENGRGFTSKYPFGTVHYVAALLEHVGIDIVLDLGRPISPTLTVMDLFMRADGAAENSMKYAHNAAEWWLWLKEVGGPFTAQMAEEATSIASSSGGFASTKASLSREFARLGCTSSDANFASLLARDPRSAEAVVSSFWNWLAVPGGPEFGPMRRYDGRHVRVSPDSVASEELLQRTDLFTYAFTGTRAGGFSATLMSA